MKGIRRLVWLVMVYVAVQALREQLSLPPEERTWFGRVGPVPYDFRVPSLDKVRNALWNPDDNRLFTGMVLGIGWTVNFAQVVRIARELRQQAQSMAAN